MSSKANGKGRNPCRAEECRRQARLVAQADAADTDMQRLMDEALADVDGWTALSHEQLFGHLAGDDFTAQEAAEYLEVSMSTFRRIVTSGKLAPSSSVGRNQMFAVPDLKTFKKALKVAKG